MNETTAARLLGVPRSEISEVTDAPAGDVIVTEDAARYVVVPDDQPDARGKTGLMYLVAPTTGYTGSFPVYAQPGAVATDAAEPEPQDEKGEDEKGEDEGSEQDEKTPERQQPPPAPHKTGAHKAPGRPRPAADKR
jgi:hypothetical protein